MHHVSAGRLAKRLPEKDQLLRFFFRGLLRKHAAVVEKKKGHLWIRRIVEDDGGKQALRRGRARLPGGHGHPAHDLPERERVPVVLRPEAGLEAEIPLTDGTPRVKL